MSIWGALAGGFVGTLVLTSGLRACSELDLTRMDLPFLLGTAFTTDRTRAKAVGYAAPLRLRPALRARLLRLVLAPSERRAGGSGRFSASLHALFAGTALVNVLLPPVHPRMGTATTAADASPLLEPPGFLLLNYGASTPVVTLVVTSPTERSSGSSWRCPTRRPGPGARAAPRRPRCRSDRRLARGPPERFRGRARDRGSDH